MNAESNNYGGDCSPCIKIKADITATRDSYSTRYPLVDIEDIIDMIELKEYNKYRGGEIDSLQAIIYKYKKGFQLKDCIKLHFQSEEECRRFESIIEDYVEVIPRKWR